jgi:hypothetical protein
MKKHLLILTLLLWSFSYCGFSQVTFQKAIGDNPGFTNTNQTFKATSQAALPDSSYRWFWDAIENKWNLYSKHIYRYDSEHNLTGDLIELWNGTVWNYLHLYSYTYNANNNRTSDSIQTWNGSKWVDSISHIYSYDNNNLTSDLFRFRDGSALVDSSKHTYTYNSNNKRVKDLFQYRNGITWRDTTQNTYNYDIHNNRLSDSLKVWDGIAWVDRSQHFYTYDTYNNLITDTTNRLFYWLVPPYWKKFSAEVYSYNVNNKLINMTSTFIVGEGVGANVIQWIYTYDSFNNRITALLQAGFGWTWQNSSQYLFSYDAENNLISSLSQTWNGIAFVNSDSTHNYFPGTTGIIDLKLPAKNITIYPNPSRGNFIITLPDAIKKGLVEIYNAFGERIFSETVYLTSTREINLGNVPAGMYFLKVSDGTTRYTQKIIIE